MTTANPPVAWLNGVVWENY